MRDTCPRRNGGKQEGGKASKALRVIARRRRGIRMKMEEDIGYWIWDIGYGEIFVKVNVNVDWLEGGKVERSEGGLVRRWEGCFAGDSS